MARLIDPGIQPGARLRTSRNASAALPYSYCSISPAPWKWAAITASSSPAGISFFSGCGSVLATGGAAGGEVGGAVIGSSWV